MEDEETHLRGGPLGVGNVFLAPLPRTRASGNGEAIEVEGETLAFEGTESARRELVFGVGGGVDVELGVRRGAVVARARRRRRGRGMGVGVGVGEAGGAAEGTGERERCSGHRLTEARSIGRRARVKNTGTDRLTAKKKNRKNTLRPLLPTPALNKLCMHGPST